MASRERVNPRKFVIRSRIVLFSSSSWINARPNDQEPITRTRTSTRKTQFIPLTVSLSLVDTFTAGLLPPTETAARQGAP